MSGYDNWPQGEKEKGRIVDTLLLARDTIADPAHWTKGCDFGDAFGQALNYTTPAGSEADYGQYLSPETKTYCMRGAVIVASKQTGVPWRLVLSVLEHELDSILSANSWKRQTGVTSFNDANTTTHAEVIEMFDECVRRIKG